MKELIKRLDDVGCGEKWQGWYFERIKAPETSIKGFDFYQTRVELGVQEISAENIVGTTHVNYQNKTWLEMLCFLPRYRKTSRERIEVFCRGDEKTNEPLHYIKYGEKYFICGGGNHRTCLAKFYEIPTIKADVTEYLLNEERYGLYQQCRQNNILLNKGGGVYDWEITINAKRIFVKDNILLQLILDFYVSTNLTQKYYMGIKLGLLRPISMLYGHNINEEKDIDRLFADVLIAKHALTSRQK